MDQFISEYASDPAIEVITSLTSELLNFGEVTLTYSSSDNAVVYFETVDGKTTMHCAAPGTATVTVTATLGDVSATDTVEITVSAPPTFDADNVQAAIDAEVGETVTIQGIVGPSLVNQTGFYLIDETGVMAILTTSDVMATLELGNEIVLSGTKVHKTKGGSDYFGQTHLGDITVLANYYGTHEYSTESFVSGLTVQDLHDLDATVDYSTTVFVVTGTVNFPEGYGSVTVTSGDASFSLYHGNAKQYAFLEQFSGQEITLEIAACNWNSKTYWRGCVLSVITEDGKVYNTLNFDAE